MRLTSKRTRSAERGTLRPSGPQALLSGYWLLATLLLTAAPLAAGESDAADQVDEIRLLRAEINMLKATVKARDETIKARDEKIEKLEGYVAELKKKGRERVLELLAVKRQLEEAAPNADAAQLKKDLSRLQHRMNMALRMNGMLQGRNAELKKQLAELKGAEPKPPTAATEKKQEKTKDADNPVTAKKEEIGTIEQIEEDLAQAGMTKGRRGGYTDFEVLALQAVTTKWMGRTVMGRGQIRGNPSRREVIDGKEYLGFQSSSCFIYVPAEYADDDRIRDLRKPNAEWTGKVYKFEIARHQHSKPELRLVTKQLSVILIDEPEEKQPATTQPASAF